MTSLFLWLQLALAASIILGSSQFLTRAVDQIATKTKLGRSFLGVVMLATATSLPELGTGISSITLVGEPDLAAGDAFGSNLFNLLIIGLLDLGWRDGPILNKVGKEVAVVGLLGATLIALSGGGILLHQATSSMDGLYTSPISIILLISLFIAIFIIYRGQRNDSSTESTETSMASTISLKKSTSIYLVSAGIIIGTSIWLSIIGQQLSEELGWETSFIGTQFLALSTSLPEFAASIAAIQLNAPELAISNVLGSNLFNMGFVLFVDDLVYTDGAILSGLSRIHALSAALAVAMTLVVTSAILLKNRRRPVSFLTVEAIVIIGVYAASSFLVFNLN